MSNCDHEYVNLIIQGCFFHRWDTWGIRSAQCLSSRPCRERRYCTNVHDKVGLCPTKEVGLLGLEREC